MEIQDRNSLLQILTGVRDANVQFSSASDNAFAEVLKSTQNEVSISPKNTNDAEFKPSLKQSDVSNNVKDVEKKTFDGNKSVSNKEDSPKKAEAKNAKSSKSENQGVKKDDDNAEKSVAANQSTEKAYKEEKTDVADTHDTDESVVYTDDSVESGELAPENQEMISAGIAMQGVDDSVLMSVFQNTLISDVEATADIDEVMSIQNNIQSNIEEIPMTEMSKHEVAETSNTVADDFVPMSKEEALLMEQAKYFDEKVASDKKLKIKVDVSEEKIAAPIVKDVLKNRFEIDSMFQSVDVEVKPETLVADAENIVEDVPVVDSEFTDMTEAKNIVYNEVKTLQDAVKTTATKDTTVMAVSGKEVVAETANISKNEAFAKINETNARDNFKGMAKEVVEQIKVNITKSAIKGVDTIDIQLKPEDLGKIQIKMHIAKDGRIQADIIASRAETADLLQKDASALSKAFNEAGYDTDSKSFSFSFQNENQARGQEKDNSELLKFIGDSLEQEAENIAGNDNLTYDPILGLNIKV